MVIVLKKMTIIYMNKSDVVIVFIITAVIKAVALYPFKKFHNSFYV